jgi:RHS repeat-associated protein
MRQTEFGEGRWFPLYKFTGKERDSESGLDNFGARYLGSSLGRFMTPDEPFYDGDIHDPQKLNLYSSTLCPSGSIEVVGLLRT